MATLDQQIKKKRGHNDLILGFPGFKGVYSKGEVEVHRFNGFTVMPSQEMEEWLDKQVYKAHRICNKLCRLQN